MDPSINVTSDVATLVVDPSSNSKAEVLPPVESPFDNAKIEEVPPLVKNPSGNEKEEMEIPFVYCIECCIHFATEIKFTLSDELLAWV